MTRTLTTSVSPSLLAFKPRQVLLSRHTTKKANDIEAPMSAIKAVSLDPEQRTLLLHAVSLFLQRNGFSKTLKKFRSEAQIEVSTSNSGSSRFHKSNFLVAVVNISFIHLLLIMAFNRLSLQNALFMDLLVQNACFVQV